MSLDDLAIVKIGIQGPKGAGILQSANALLATDMSVNSMTFETLLEVDITTTVGSSLLVFASGAVSSTGSNRACISVDGVQYTSMAVTPGFSFVHRITGLAAGLHTVKILWLGNADCRPIAASDDEHASLVVMEVNI